MGVISNERLSNGCARYQKALRNNAPGWVSGILRILGSETGAGTGTGGVVQFNFNLIKTCAGMELLVPEDCTELACVCLIVSLAQGWEHAYMR